MSDIGAVTIITLVLYIIGDLALFGVFYAVFFKKKVSFINGYNPEQHDLEKFSRYSGLVILTISIIFLAGNVIPLFMKVFYNDALYSTGISVYGQALSLLVGISAYVLSGKRLYKDQ